MRFFLVFAAVAMAASSAPAWPKAAPAPAAKKATSAEDAVFLAAGFKRKGRSWHSDCDDPGTPSYTPGAVEMVGDLNRDGLPEAIVTEGGTYCYGATGTGFWLLSQQRAGGWQLITQSQGIPEMLKTRGVGGWPDISIGGPGFCFPVQRWNGKAYVLHRKEYDGKPCKG